MILNDPAALATSTETVVNYVVEVRVPGKPWLSMEHFGGSDEHKRWARKAYRTWRGGRGHLEVQLVKRTAVITNEVLEEGVQGHDHRADAGGSAG